MLGYITGFADGQMNALLGQVAVTLQAEGVVLAGVVQVNDGTGRDCAMDLHLLGGGEVVRISQNLGPGSQGCRLDADALERAVGLVEARLEAGVDLLIINKFGKQEADGRGFRPLIGQALTRGIPVVIAVTEGHRAAFAQFAQGFGQALEPAPAAVMAFCHAALRRDAVWSF